MTMLVNIISLDIATVTMTRAAFTLTRV